MFKALLLTFDTARTWDRISIDRRSTAFVLFAYLLPMLLMTSVIEGYGMMKWGEPQGNVAYIRHFTAAGAAIYLAVQLGISLLIVLVGAWIIKSLGETFHGRHSFNQSLTVVAYGLSPMFTLRVVDAFAVTPWVAWAVGIVLSVAILYQGVPRIMKPDPPHAFGLYLTSTLMLILATGLARFVTAWYLLGKFDSVKPVEDAARHLLHHTV